jgi:hypothetical protein
MTVDSDADTPRVPIARKLRRESLIILGFLVLTAAMTWPWVMHLRDTVADEGDSYAHAYFLWWDYHQTFHDPRHLFDATIFYPYRNTLAFGENDYGIALVLFPLFALGLRPLTVYSIAAFLSFPFTGYGMFRLGRTLSGSAGVGWVAGIFFAFIPYRFDHLSHLPLIFAGWIPLVLEALILFARVRSWRRAAWLGVVFFMNALTCVTWFILTLIPLMLSGLILRQSYRVWRDRSFWLRGVFALGAASLLLLPFLLPFRQVAQVHGFVRTPAEVQMYSARLASWLAVQQGNRIWKSLGAARLDYEMALFPGVVLLLSALLGFTTVARKVVADLLRRERVVDDSTSRGNFELFAHGLLWSVIGFAGSFGLNFYFHRALYQFVPLFRSMRVAVRWSMICYVGLALMAALGAKRAVELMRRHWPGFPGALIFTAVILAVLLDQRVAPMSLVRGEVDPDQLALYLKGRKLSGGIVELPAGDPSPRYMLRAADHGQPLVTARNSFAPSIVVEIEELTASQPIPDRLLDLLETIPASYVVIHNSFMSPERRLQLELFLRSGANAGRLRFVRSFDSGARNGLRRRDDLYAVVKTEPAAQTEGPPPPPVSREGLEPLFTGRVADFQQAGFFIYRLYRVSYGRAPLYTEFTAEMQLLRYEPAGGSERFEASKEAFANAWTDRREFKKEYAAASDEQYLDVLLANAGLSKSEANRERLIGELQSGKTSRSKLLTDLIENNALAVREFNPAFVLMHYFAYLKRDPDEGGYHFWLYKLERYTDYSGFTEAFAASTERQLELQQP